MSKKSIWKILWEPEDSHLFGEIFLIAGSLLIARFIELILPNIGKWLYLGIGFVLVLFGIRLLRKSNGN